MKILAAVLVVAALSGRVCAEPEYITDEQFLVACNDGAHEAADRAHATAPARQERLSGTLPDPHSLNIAGLKACDQAVSRAVPGHYAGPGLMLLTEKHAYYYSEDCDICASLDVCELSTLKVRNVISAHSVSCTDLDGIRKAEKVLYDSCTK